MRVLIVASNPLLLKAARDFLAALPGCEALTARSGEEALRLAGAHDLDLVLLDYALRGEGGLELPRRLKLAPRAPLIVLMAPEEASSYRAACLASGADGCVAKYNLGAELPRLLADLPPPSHPAAHEGSP